LVNYLEEEMKKIIPNDDEVIRSLKNDGIYDKNVKTTRFILIQLERERGNFFNKDIIDALDFFLDSVSL